MRLKRRHLILAYAVALWASHAWQRRHPAAEAAPSFTPGEAGATPVILTAALARGAGREIARQGPAAPWDGSALPAGPVFLLAERAEAPAALRLAAEFPDTLRGLILLDPVGPEEFTGLGHAILNQALAHLWVGLVRLVQDGVPHFGTLANRPVRLSDARAWTAVDAADIRGHAARVACPVLVLRSPALGPLLEDAAGPLLSRMPQARRVAIPAAHPERVAREVRSFTAAASAGAPSFPWRPAGLPAPAGDEPRPRMPSRTLWIAVLLLALCMQTSEDLTCVAAGLIASTGFLPLGWAMLGCGLGLVLGDAGLYLLGRAFGRPLLRMRPFRWMAPASSVDRASARFTARGFRIVFASRFMPGMRVPVYLAAGILHMPFGRFLLYLTLAAAAWTPLLVGLCWHFGKPMLAWFEAHREHALAGTIAVFLALWWLVHVGLPLFTWRGRRLWLGAWRRRLHWEYWPRWAFYPPVALYLLGLMIRHRSITLPTAVNPGLPAGGGLIEESKSAILAGLGSNGEWVARWRLLPRALPLEEKLAACREFGFPCVLKPDTGCRGDGVGIIDHAADAETYLRACPRDVILQAFVPGVEYGIFYARRPGETTGRIISITDKHQTAVVGDGACTLEELILADPRGSAMARLFLAKHAAQLERVPAAGEVVPLTRLGTHARGALFRDASDLLTPALEARIEEISRRHEGFYFGRYDIRGPSAEAFRAGGPFQVVELNGLTAESTHIYDPRTPLWKAYRTLFAQWRLAFEIAAVNRAAGHAPLSLREVRALFRQHAERPAFESPV